MEKQIRNIPMVALRGMTIMPEMVVHFDVSRAYSIQAIQQVMQGEEQQVFLVAQRELNIEDPDLRMYLRLGRSRQSSRSLNCRRICLEC